MKKLNLDNVKIQSNSKLRAGAYVCKIVKALYEEKQQRLNIYVDIDEGEFKDYYKSRGEASGQKQAKWFYPNVTLWCDETSPYWESNSKNLKQMITSVENSNDSYTFNWDEKTLVGKSVGVLFRDKEFMTQDGKVMTTTEPLVFRSVEAVRKGDIPLLKPKTLNQEEKSTQAFDVLEETLPFDTDIQPQKSKAEDSFDSIFDDTDLDELFD